MFAEPELNLLPCLQPSPAFWGLILDPQAKLSFLSPAYVCVHVRVCVHVSRMERMTVWFSLSFPANVVTECYLGDN